MGAVDLAVELGPAEVTGQLSVGPPRTSGPVGPPWPVNPDWQHPDNLCPPLSEWAGGGTLDGDVLTLTDQDNHVEVWIRTAGAERVWFSADVAVEVPAPNQDPDGGRHWEYHYYDVNMEPVESDAGWLNNGATAAIPLDGHFHRTWNAPPTLGSQVEWVRWRMRADSVFTSPLQRVKLPAARTDGSGEYPFPPVNLDVTIGPAHDARQTTVGPPSRTPQLALGPPTI